MQNEYTYFIFEYILYIYRSDKFIWRKLRANILAAVFVLMCGSNYSYLYTEKK